MRSNCAISAASAHRWNAACKKQAFTRPRSFAPQPANTCVRLGVASKASATGCSCAASTCPIARPRGSIGHSHVLGLELRSFAGARTVLFKLLAKAAMRLRHEGYLAGRLAIRVRFVGHEQRFERDLDFAPLDDTPSLLALLGIQLRLLECEMHERERRRQHPPLSVAVTLMNLTPRGDLTLDLIQERDRAQRLSSVLDRLNMRFGNNTVYFGAMQDAIAQDAAPMRIPFSKIPETALEQDILTRKRSLASAGESDDELWLQPERQFKALAEGAHREAQQRASKRARQSRADAGGWSHDPRRTLAPRPGESFDLF